MKLIIDNKFKRSFHFILLILFSSIFILSCANTTNKLIRLYEGPKLATQDVVTLILPYELEVTEIDGRTFKSPNLINGRYKIELLPGKHEIAVIYSEAWGIEYDSAIVTSELFIFRLPMAAGESFIFKHNAPEDLQQAEYTMITSDIKVWLQQLGATNNIQAANVTGQSSLFQQSNRKVTRSPYSLSPESLMSSSASQDANKQLQFWWKMADDKQRKTFSDWVRKRSLNGKGVTN